MLSVSLRAIPLSNLKLRLNGGGLAAFSGFAQTLESDKRKNAPQILHKICRRIIRTQDHLLGDLLLPAALEIGRENFTTGTAFLKTAAILPNRRKEVTVWLAMIADVSRAHPGIARIMVEKIPSALDTYGVEQLADWMGLAFDTARDGLFGPAKAFLDASTNHGGCKSLSRWASILNHAAAIANISNRGAVAFTRYGHQACEGLDDEGIATWISNAAAMALDESDAFNYFLGASDRSAEAITPLLPRVRLEKSLPILRIVCKALTGREVTIRSNAQLSGAKGFSGGPATDGNTIYLPKRAHEFEIFKLMALHQTAMMEIANSDVRGSASPDEAVSLHLEADRKLTGLLPGMLRKMERQSGETLPNAYPFVLPEVISRRPSWWGDYLPAIAVEKDRKMEQLKERALEETYLPPELIEALLGQLGMQLQGDTDVLWEMFKTMIQDVDLKSPDAEDLDTNVETFLYPEWDRHISAHREKWCMVRQIPPDDTPNGFVADARSRLHGTISLVRRQFMRLKPEASKKMRAQAGGDEIDIDEVVRALSDRKSGATPSDRIYIRRDKRVRDVSALFLLDMSNSMEEGSNGERMIDMQKDAMVVMAEALEALQDNFAIFGFSTEGRFRVNLYEVKTFQEPYSEEVQYRIGNIEPKKLTRLGTVIRHGTYQLNSVSSAVKLLIIFTDGKPFDLEYGNLNYALDDTMKAVQETKKVGVHPFLITSDTESASYLDKIIPETQRLILQHPQQLPDLMPRIYKRLTL